MTLLNPPEAMSKFADSPKAKFPIEMNTVAGIIGWMTARGQTILDLGRPCSYKNIGQEPLTTWKSIVELDSDMLQGLAEILQNKTVAGILHNIQLPKNVTHELSLLPGDGESHLQERLSNQSKISWMRLGYHVVRSRRCLDI
jgi:hypothetical protein